MGTGNDFAPLPITTNAKIFLSKIGACPHADLEIWKKRNLEESATFTQLQDANGTGPAKNHRND